MQLLLIRCGDDPSSWLPDRLAENGYRLRLASSSAEALQNKLVQGTVAVMISTGPTSPQGEDMVAHLRKAGVSQPIVLISDRGAWRERVASLDAGADDYLVKPMRSEEIAARLRAVIRRSAGVPHDRVHIGEFDLDLNARCAWRNGECLELTRNEFRLLQLLMLESDRIHSPTELRDRVQTRRGEMTLNAVEVQITRLRRKVGKERIRTVRGVGYRFVLEKNDDDTPPVPGEPCKNGQPKSCDCPPEEGTEG